MGGIGSGKGGQPRYARRNPEIDTFIDRAITYEKDDCLLWPFARDGNGYAMFGSSRFKRKYGTQYVSRAICSEAHGAPSTKDHLAAHSCGNGHLGCISGKHLRWATSKENSADDNRGEDRHNAKLATYQVLEIKELAKTMNAKVIAEQYGTSKGAIDGIIYGKNWSWLEAPCDAELLFATTRPRMRDLFA